MDSAQLELLRAACISAGLSSADLQRDLEIFRSEGVIPPSLARLVPLLPSSMTVSMTDAGASCDDASKSSDKGKDKGKGKSRAAAPRRQLASALSNPEPPSKLPRDAKPSRKKR